MCKLFLIHIKLRTFVLRETLYVIIMSLKLDPPDLLECCSYERYKQELAFWRGGTSIEKKKQGLVLALSLPKDRLDPERKIRSKVFEQLTEAKLSADDGYDVLVKFLDEHLGTDEMADSIEKFEDFESYVREDNSPINDFISTFDQKYQRVVQKQLKLPQPILAFMLLKRARLTKEEKMLILTGMNFDEKDKLYDQAKASLRKFLGNQPTGGASASGGKETWSKVAIKLEPAFLAENEEALMVAGYVKRDQWRGRGRSGYRGTGRGGGFGRGFGSYSESRGSGYSRGYGNNSGGDNKGRHVNANGPDGKPMTCNSCGSYRHLMAKCPDSWENMKPVRLVEEPKEDVVLFTGFNKASVSQLSVEARNCAVLDSACSSTVCGKNWLDCYVESLNEEDRDKIVYEEGQKVFKFGGGEKLKSAGSYSIPAVLAGQDVTITTDVVASEIPLLLSSKAMKKARVKLDLENDTGEILGVKVTLNHTSSGHYCIPIDRASEADVESVCAVKLEDMNAKERYNAILKLPRQFAHPPVKRLRTLMKDAGVWNDEYESDLDAIHQRCDICKLYAKTPDRPAVAMPMATQFNEKVCLDLKKWGNKWILHMIDMFSRFTVSVFISRKFPSEVINKIMTCWIGAGFGVMQGLLTDNGGEFNADEMRDAASVLNIELCTTAAESPFQNGLCERNHAVTDMMLMKMRENSPNTSLEVLLGWANMQRIVCKCGMASAHIR